MKSAPYFRQSPTLITGLVLATLLSGCGGSSGGGDSAPATYTVGGTISGLTGGTLKLQNNGSSDTLDLSQSGNYTFQNVALTQGESYNVTIHTQPDNHACELSNGSGTVGRENITNISVSCQTIYSIGGTVTGLTEGATLTLNNNNNDPLTIAANSTFSFTQQLSSGSTYSVTITNQPDGHLCELSNASGSVNNETITNISVNCQPSYSIGGSVSGLNGTLVLQNNNANDLTLTENGNYTFDLKLTQGQNYNVSIHTAPDNYRCNLNNASGSVETSHISNIDIQCGVIPTGYYHQGNASVKADDNTTDLNITDLQALINDNRLMLISIAEGLLYDGTITISGDTYSGEVTIYRGGQRISSSPVNVSGTIVGGSSINGTLAGTGAGNGTFSLTYAQSNSQEAALSRVQTTTSFELHPDDYPNDGDTWSVNPYGVPTLLEFFVIPDGRIGHYDGPSQGKFTFCAFSNSAFGDGSVSMVNPAIHSALYTVNVTLFACDQEDVNSNYTGLATSVSLTNPDDAFLMAFSDGESAVIGEFLYTKR